MLIVPFAYSTAVRRLDSSIRFDRHAPHSDIPLLISGRAGAVPVGDGADFRAGRGPA
jgi:hypothetical protein